MNLFSQQNINQMNVATQTSFQNEIEKLKKEKQQLLSKIESIFKEMNEKESSMFEEREKYLLLYQTQQVCFFFFDFNFCYLKKM